MALDTGEELLAAALGAESRLASAAISIDPFIVPYDQLAHRDGWAVWLDHPPVPSGLPLLPVPDHLLWDDPRTALATTAAIAADYAARRGAVSVAAMAAILRRESPVALIVPGSISTSLTVSIDELTSLGVPIVTQPDELADLPQFVLRHHAHAQLTSRAHDPALSFQQFVINDAIGRDARSAFIVHESGNVDGVVIDGRFDARIGIEIGVRGAALADMSIMDLELAAAHIPAFLNGVTTRLKHGALQIGWRTDAKPTAEMVGTIFHTWLHELFDLDIVDVHLIFAPEDDDSPALGTLNARADALRRERAFPPVFRSQDESRS